MTAHGRVALASLGYPNPSSRGNEHAQTWACTNATAKADLKNYGFLLSPLCGIAS